VTDIWDEEKRSEVMSRIRSKDTKPELKIKEFLDEIGTDYEYQADIDGWIVDFLVGDDLVIEYRSCFWHKHGCGESNIPKSNRDYWVPKLEGNRERDEEKDTKLRDAGYEVEVVWGCEGLEERLGEIFRTFTHPSPKGL